MSYAPIASVKVSAGTSSAIDTTGAAFLVAVCSSATPVSAPTDSKSNTWHALTNRVGASSGATRMFYAFNPTVGSGHTFTPSGSLPSGVFAAFSGAPVTDPFDVESAGSFEAGGTGGQPGTLTPSAPNALVVVAMGDVQSADPVVSSPSYAVISQLTIGGTSYGSALGYLIQTTATAVNPNCSNCDCQIQAAFAAASGGGGGITLPELERGTRGLGRGLAGYAR